MAMTTTVLKYRTLNSESEEVTSTKFIYQAAGDAVQKSVELDVGESRLILAIEKEK